MLESPVDDLRLAARGLRRARGFTAGAVLTLAVGMAGATGMFALIEGVLVRPLPMPAPDQLVAIWKENGTRRFRSDDVRLISDGTARVFSRVAAIGYSDPSPVAIVDGQASAYVNIARVGGDFFDVLALRPLLGRTLTRSDDTTGAAPVIVITHGLWQRRYGGAADVIGRRLTIVDRRVEIVGVMPPDAEYPRAVDAWMTIEARASLAANTTFQQATRNELTLIARLQPGVTADQAAGAMAVLSPQLALTAPAGAGDTAPVSAVRPLSDVMVGDIRTGMIVLFGAVAVVLLVASANVANLLLVRGETRRPEMALRTALGATRGRLARQIVAESLVLSAFGGIIAFAATWGSLRTLVAISPVGLPRVEAIRVDGGVVLFALALTLTTTIIAALVPAFAAGRVALLPHVQAGGRTVTRRTMRGRAVLVAAQVAMAVTVVAAAGLVTRSLLRLESTGTELGADRLVFVSLALPRDRYADQTRHHDFLEELVRRLQATPTVTAATPINATPFSGAGWDVPAVTAEGQNAAQVATNGALHLEAIQPGYFDTFGVAIVSGRSFDARDRDGAVAVVIVSQDAASRIWPGQNPIGKRLKMGDLESKDVWRTVVGVASRTRYRDLRASHPTLYLPDSQLLVTAQSLAVRSTSPLPQVAGDIRAQVNAIDPTVQVPRVAPFDELLREPLARPRFYALVLGAFGATALLLSAIGLYAVIAASVRQRYAEIGVRLAVGASPADVRRLVLREGMVVATCGAVIGLAVALAVAQSLRALLYEVSPLDPAALAGAALLLLAAAAVSSYLPARAAARLDPLIALRHT